MMPPRVLFLAVLALAAAAIAAVLVAGPAQEEAPRREATQPEGRRQDASRLAAQDQAAPRPAPADPAPPDAKPHDAKLEAAPDASVAIGLAYAVEPPFLVRDGRTFATEGGPPTRIAGLDGPDAEAVCLDEAGRLWACGLQARAALNNLIRRQTVSCRTVAPADHGVLVSSCRVAAGDLGAELARSGFARSATATSPGSDASRAEEDARQAGRGLWRGGWSIRP